MPRKRAGKATADPRTLAGNLLAERRKNVAILLRPENVAAIEPYVAESWSGRFTVEQIMKLWGNVPEEVFESFVSVWGIDEIIAPVFRRLYDENGAWDELLPKLREVYGDDDLFEMSANLRRALSGAVALQRGRPNGGRNSSKRTDEIDEIIKKAVAEMNGASRVSEDAKNKRAKARLSERGIELSVTSIRNYRKHPPADGNAVQQ